MTVRRHRRYSTEFKIQLVQAYLDGEGSVRKIATRHGVPHSLLAIWIRKYEAGELAEEVYLQEQVSEYEARIGALERKIGQLTMELDVMKKRALIRPSDQSAPLSANVRETRSTQRIRVGRRQRNRTCWDCEREWKRMVVPLEPGRPSEARQLLRTQR